MILVGVKESLPGGLCLCAAATEIEEEVAERQGVLADRLCETGRPAGWTSFVAHTGQGGTSRWIVVAASLGPGRRGCTRLLPSLSGSRVTLQGNIDELRQAQLGSIRVKVGWNSRQLLAGQWTCGWSGRGCQAWPGADGTYCIGFHSGKLCRHAEHAMAATSNTHDIRPLRDSQHRRAVR